MNKQKIIQDLIIEKKTTIKEIKKNLIVKNISEFAIIVDGKNVTSFDDMEIETNQRIVIVPKISGG